MPNTNALKIAVFGDVHSSWNESDLEYFNESDHDLLLFVGDLCGYRGGFATLEAITQLKKKVIVMPGNHDAVNLMHLYSEVIDNDFIRSKYESKFLDNRKKFDLKAQGFVEVGGYNWFKVEAGDKTLAVICGRPHSMGGRRLHFHHYLKTEYGINTFDDSVARLKTVIDDCPIDDVIFLAHNGPYGLGNKPSDIWGCDFNPKLGDFGDLDLKKAVEYASTKKKVWALFAGHMHHRLKVGGYRRWYEKQNEIQYVNAARVPRIFYYEGQKLHHFVEAVWSEDDFVVQPKFFRSKDLIPVSVVDESVHVVSD